MTDALTLKILADIAAPGSGHLFSRREAARNAIARIEQQAEAIKGAAVIANEAGAEIRAMKERVAELEAARVAVSEMSMLNARARELGYEDIWQMPEFNCIYGSAEKKD